jgi:hypothetical protein
VRQPTELTSATSSSTCEHYFMSVTHEPPGYQCPFCKLAAGSDGLHNCQDDIVRRTSDAMALISPRW